MDYLTTAADCKEYNDASMDYKQEIEELEKSIKSRKKK